MSFTSGAVLTASALNTFEPGTKIKTLDGSASAPTYSFKFADGTGMFRTSGDDVAFATGGTQRVTIQGDGQVGIGTTNPFAPLQVFNASTDTVARFGSGDAGVYISFYDNTSASETNARIGAYGDKLVLLAGGSDRIVIKSDGKVGIGTTLPAEELHMLKDQDGVLTQMLIENIDQRLRVGAYYEAGVAQYSKIQSEADGGSDQPLVLNPEGGNVGVGLTSPAAKLDVNGTGKFVDLTVTGVIDVNEVLGDNGGASDPSFTFTTDTDTGMYRVSSNQLGFCSGGTLRGRFYSNGLLMGSGASTGNAQIGTGTGSASAPVYHFYNDSNTGMYRSGADELAFTTGGSQRVKITSGGTLIWINSSGIGGPLTDTSSTSGFRYVLQNQFFGTLQDFTSIRDRKEQITNVTTADSARWIDALQPVTYIERWLGEGEEPADNKKWREADMQVGFIADDVLASSDTSHFAQATDNGAGGLDPSGWKWETVIAAAVAEIKSLRARVATLEA